MATANPQPCPPCFHCGLPGHPAFGGEIGQQWQSFCCVGCKAIALLIHDSGLDAFYNHRETLPFKRPAIAEMEEDAVAPFAIYDDIEYQRDFVRDGRAQNDHSGDSPIGASRVARLQLYGLTCSACAWLIEKQLEHHPAVRDARVNYSRRVLHLEWQPDQAPLSELVLAVTQLGFECSPQVDDGAEAGRESAEQQQFLRRIGIAGIGMMQVGMYAMAGYLGASEATDALLRMASLFIATAVIFYSAQPFFAGAWRAVRHGYLSMDVPVALALGLAYTSSLYASWQTATGEAVVSTEVYFDAICMFCLFLLVSRYFEFKARTRWQRRQQAPTDQDKATLIDDEGRQQLVSSRSLRPGQTILIKTGELYPVDVVLNAGLAEISQAQLTGEFSPLMKKQHDEISSGSLNLGQPVQANVIRPVNESTLSQINHLVAEAQLHKPHISGLADQLSGYFVGAVLLLALASYGFWSFQAPEQAFWIALSVLVVSCPCALSLATPTALTVLMHDLHAKGILVQNPAALEKLKQMNQVIFDKTGTLTHGEFEIKAVVDLTNEGTATHLLRAALLESRSNHPIARAFLTDTTEPDIRRCTDWHSIEGQGVEARIDGTLYRMGGFSFVSGLLASVNQTVDIDQSEKQVYLGNETQLCACFTLTDQLRYEARSVVDYLHKAYRHGVTVLSGDQPAQVEQIANRLGIEDAHSELSATQKISRLQTMRANGKRILAVGDGLNDAPLLSSADVSIAVSNAVDVSKQKADFILLANDLSAIGTLFESARTGQRIIVQNLSWALAYNICAIPLAMMGLVPPWVAALGMSASSAVVVLNAFRARIKPKPQNGYDNLNNSPRIATAC